MRLAASVLVTLLPALCLAALLSAAQATPQPLEDVLNKMDAAAKGFETVVANITYTKVTVIVDDKSVEKGQIFFKRSRAKRGDFKIRINFREPSEKIVLFSDNKGYIYRPAIAQVEEYDVSKNKQTIEQFLLLGFGTPGHDLANAYNITLAGDAKVGNEDAVKLELLPKSPGIARHIRKVELWLSRKTWQPVQQTFTEPSGDYLTTLYEALKLNAAIADDQFKLKTRGKVKTVRPQAG